ncbi:MAG: hypothetical protein ABIO63_00600 [Casimicrobiaceae bacterium]
MRFGPRPDRPRPSAAAFDLLLQPLDLLLLAADQLSGLFLDLAAEDLQFAFALILVWRNAHDESLESAIVADRSANPPDIRINAIARMPPHVPTTNATTSHQNETIPSPPWLFSLLVV